MDPRSIEQDNFETNSRIFPKQLFHSFPVRSNDSGLDGRNHDGSHKKWTPTSHNPTHLSFARLGPSSPSDVPLRYTTTSCHPSLGASPTPVGQGGAKHKSSGRTSHLVLPEKGRWTAATKPHPKHQQQSHHPKRWSHFHKTEEVPRLHSNPR